MDLEKLILCVQTRKVLWDQKCKEYHNRATVKRAWNDVAKEMEDTCKYSLFFLKVLVYI